MRAAKVQASLRIRAVSPEPLLLAHTSSESRGTFRQSQIPGPSEWLDMRSWNLSWRNARRHKFAWRGSVHKVMRKNTKQKNQCLCFLFRLLLPYVKRNKMAPFTKPVWSGPNPYWTTVQTKFSVPKIWSGRSGLKSVPKRDLLMCKDHGPIEFGPVPKLAAPCSSDQIKWEKSE